MSGALKDERVRGRTVGDRLPFPVQLKHDSPPGYPFPSHSNPPSQRVSGVQVEGGVCVVWSLT